MKLNTRHRMLDTGSSRSFVRSLLLAAMITAAPLSALSVTDEEEAVLVTVLADDTLSSIALRYLGSEEFWPEIARVNEVKKPNQLQIGQVLSIPVSLLDSKSYVRVAYVKGDVGYTSARDQFTGELDNRRYLFAGDSVQTADASFVSLVFRDDSIVNVQPDSEMRISELDCVGKDTVCKIKLWLQRGDSSVQVQERDDLQKPVEFTIETPYASAVVRGTGYDISSREGDGTTPAENLLGVTKGLVQISAGGIESLVPQGKGTVAGAKIAVSRLFELLGPPKYLMSPSQLKRVSREDWLSWLPLRGATGYALNIYEGSGAQGWLTGDFVESPFVQVDLAPGTYTAELRGVDERGLRGFRGAGRIHAVQVDESADLQPLKLGLLEDVLRLETSADLPGEYEVRIGDRLQEINGLEYLVDYQSRDLKNAKSYHIAVDVTRDVFIQYRRILDSRTVTNLSPIEKFSVRRTR